MQDWPFQTSRYWARIARGKSASVLFAGILIVGSAADAFSQKAACPPAPPYKYLRADEDYSYLRDPACRTDFFDVIKYVQLRPAPSWFLSVGGEVRENVEYVSNPRWGAQPQGSAYVLQRFMLHADVHLGERVRLFAQLKSGLENNREGGPRLIDEDKLDFNQGFLDLTLFSAPRTTVTLRAGRQELAFGSRRYISAREGPNVRQTFDGARLILSADAWHVDLFATKPVQTNRGFFDDAPDSAQTFWGVYASRPLPATRDLHIDLYYLGLDRKRAPFQQGVGRELRHSVGTRLWGKRPPWDEDLEFVYQAGTFRSASIRAWSVESDTGYTFASRRLQPRLGLKADAASGDANPKDPDLQTFNPLFPRGLYDQLIDLNGHTNFIDLNPLLALHPAAPITLTTGWDFFWRESLQDGLYNVGGFPIFRPGVSRARYIGSQISAVTEWRISRHLSAVLIYAHFAPGPFLQQTGPARTVNYGSAWVDFKF